MAWKRPDLIHALRELSKQRYDETNGDDGMARADDGDLEAIADLVLGPPEPRREIPNTNEIKSFFHCAKCMPDKPGDQSPRMWASLEVGFTLLGLQVWCKRCECNVAHIDFEGHKHPANLDRRPS